jgi:hypothetical protein
MIGNLNVSKMKHIHDLSLSFIGAGTLIKSGWLKLS